MNPSRPRRLLAVALPLCLFGLSATGCAVQANGPQMAIVVASTNGAMVTRIAGAEGARPGAAAPVPAGEPVARKAAAAQVAVDSSPLVGYWRFDEGAGNTAADRSGNGNAGALIDGAAWSTDRVPATTDLFALQLDGTRSYVRIPASSSLAITSTLTVAAWIKTSDPTRGGTGETMGVVSQPRPDGGTGYRLGVESGRANLGMNNGASWNCSLQASSTLVPGRWTHIAGTYHGDTMTVYVDGAPQGTSACASGALLPSSQAVQIGREFEILGGRHFNGLIDEARIYDTALGASEVQALFEEGRR